MRFALCGSIALSLFVCAPAHAGAVRGKVVLSKPLSIGTMSDAVIYVDPLPDAVQRKWSSRQATAAAAVVQRDRQFTPRVTVVPMGSTVRFLNRDDVYHNVFSVSPAKRFDLGKYPPQAINQVTFSRPGVVNLFCDIHPRMAAWVVVLKNRYFARPAADGTFTLPNLPAGTYTLLAWHPSFGRISRQFEVPRGRDASVALKL